MNFGKATSRVSWFPGQPESWKKAADWKKELDAKRRGPSWLGKTGEDFAQMAEARLAARQASWIGHREKTAEDYADEAKKALLREKWIKYLRRMSRKRSFGLGKDRPKTMEELAREQHEKSLQDGWIVWKRRISAKREYGANLEIRPKTPEELRTEAREKKMQLGWIKWKRRLSAKREYGLGRARSITEDERERMRIAGIQEKGWILPYMCDAQKKGWVRRYRGSLWNFDKEKSAVNLRKVDQAIEASRIRHLEMEWVKNIRKVQLPKFGLGDTQPKTAAELAQEKDWHEIENQWENLTTKRMRKRTEFGLGPRRSFTSEELRKMATEEEMEDGWEQHTTKASWNEAGKLVWEPRIPTLEELELQKIHTELEKLWRSAATEESLQDVFPLRSWPWEPKIKTAQQLKEEKKWLRQESEWLKGRSSYDQLQEGFPTVQDLVIQDLEQVWALEDMEAEVREERKKLLYSFRLRHPLVSDGSKEGTQQQAQAGLKREKVKKGEEKAKKGEEQDEWENIMLYINDKMDIDFEDDDDDDVEEDGGEEDEGEGEKRRGVGRVGEHYAVH